MESASVSVEVESVVDPCRATTVNVTVPEVDDGHCAARLAGGVNVADAPTPDDAESPAVCPERLPAE
jgi:hypothetical protein